ETDVIHAGAAVFLRHRNPEQAELCHPADNAIAIEMVIAIVLAYVGRRLACAPFAHRLLEQPLFLGQAEINHVSALVQNTRHSTQQPLNTESKSPHPRVPRVLRRSWCP